MFKMWWKIAKLAGLFFLGFGAAQDIKYQKISTEYLLAGSCAAILYVRYLDGCIGVYGLPDWDVELYFS